jgi:hypothetical protein
VNFSHISKFEILGVTRFDDGGRRRGGKLLRCRPGELGGCEGRATSQEWGWDTPGARLTEWGKIVDGAVRRTIAPMKG